LLPVQKLITFINAQKKFSRAALKSIIHSFTK
jgi:hypothetical protein